MPISDCEVRDPRMRRTRQALQGALQSLLQRKAFEEITVQDITEAAGVNRATFYDHYTDKSSLLEAWVAGGFHRLLHERSVHYDSGCATAAAPIILAACDYLLESRCKCGALQERTTFEALADAAMTSAIRRILIEGLTRHTSFHPEQRELRASAASWAICGAVKQWERMPNRPAAEAIVPVILTLVAPLIAEPRPDFVPGEQGSQPSVAST